jgi:hypothetical protein
MARGTAHAGASVHLEYILKSSAQRLEFCGLKIQENCTTVTVIYGSEALKIDKFKNG